MIIFEKGPGGQEIDENEKNKIKNAFKYNSNEIEINYAYNNAYHFANNNGNYDINIFINEVMNIVNSPIDELVILGGIHQDPYGHSSYIIGQKDKDTFYPSIVQDSYVHFKIRMKHFRPLHTLNITNSFHFLMDVPRIVKLLHKNINLIILFGIHHKDLYPKHNLRNIVFSVAGAT